MDSGAMIHISGFIKIGSRKQNLMRGYKDTQTALRSHKPALILFDNNESRVKTLTYI
jgi:hypothetical protein